MKSLRTLFIRQLIATIAGVSALLTALAFYCVHMASEEHSGRSMKYLSELKTNMVNECFSSIEKNAHAIALKLESKADIEKLRDDSGYGKQIEQSFMSEVSKPNKSHDFAHSFYFSFDKKTAPAGAGTYVVIMDKKSNNRHFFSTMKFDLADFSDDDEPYAGWFYRTKKEGGSNWFAPRKCRNTGKIIETASYTVPLHKNGEFIGAAGIDVKLERLREILDDIEYDSAFSFLIDDNGNIIYHKDFPDGLRAEEFSYDNDLRSIKRLLTSDNIGTGKNFAYKWRGKMHRLIMSRLENDIILGISVPESEILRWQLKMMFLTVLVLVLIIAGGAAVANLIASKIITPLQAITDAASRIARGELNTPVPFKSEDEIGVLAESIRKISVELKDYIAHINEMAYTDAMTGCRNKAAYIEKVKELKRRIDEDMAEFTVFMFDVNGLKGVNDKFGHENGDQLIKDAAEIMKSVFRAEKVYRIGGDEFVVLEEKLDDEKTAGLMDEFDRQLSEFNHSSGTDDGISVSKGAASFDSKTDTSTDTVFARADKAMYRDKEHFYESHRRTR